MIYRNVALFAILSHMKRLNGQKVTAWAKRIRLIPLLIAVLVGFLVGDYYKTRTFDTSKTDNQIQALLSQKNEEDESLKFLINDYNKVVADSNNLVKNWNDMGSRWDVIRYSATSNPFYELASQHCVGVFQLPLDPVLRYRIMDECPPV